MQIIAIVGEQQQARRIGVQPADGRQNRLTQRETLRQQFVDQSPAIAHRADITDRFVEHQHQAEIGIERLAFIANIVVRHAGIVFETAAAGIGEDAHA